MFFGVGAYGVSLPRYAGGTNWSALVIGLIAAAALSLRTPGLFARFVVAGGTAGAAVPLRSFR